MRRLLHALLVSWLMVGAHLAAQTPRLDATLVERSVRGVADVFAREYFDIPLIEPVLAALNAGLSDGRYGKATGTAELAQWLTRDMYAVTRDKHIAVQLSRPPGPGAPARRRDLPTTAGFRRTEILAGNVGLLELDFFLRVVEHQAALDAAMKVLQPAAALILDMRANNGGAPGTVALLMSYLFEETGRPLFEIIPRRGARDLYSSTREPIAWRDGKRPVFVLTSKNSFSGGEGLAFLLQEAKRATVIGEVTAGAANPGRSYPANDLFEVTVPNGQLLTVVSRKNWEGRGVTPDIVVPAADALTEAHTRALAALKPR